MPTVLEKQIYIMVFLFFFLSVGQIQNGCENVFTALVLLAEM